MIDKSAVLMPLCVLIGLLCFWVGGVDLFERSLHTGISWFASIVGGVVVGAILST